MSSRLLAVHRTSRGFQMALAEASIGSLRLLRVATGTTAKDLRHALAGTAPDRIFATIPTDAAVFRRLELPFSDRRRLEQAVGPSLEEHVPLSLDDATLAWDYCGPQRSGSVLAAMVSTERLEEERESLREALQEALGGTTADSTARDSTDSKNRNTATGPEKALWAPSAILEAYRRVALSSGLSGDWVAINSGQDGVLLASMHGQELLGLRYVAAASRKLTARNAVWALKALGASPGPVLLGGPEAAGLAAELGEAIGDQGRQQGRPSGHDAGTGADSDKDWKDGTPGLYALPEACPLDSEFTETDWREAPAAIGLLYTATGQPGAPSLDFSPGGRGGLSPELRDGLRRIAPWAAAAALLLLAAPAIDAMRLSRANAALEAEAARIYESAMPGKAGSAKKLKMEMRLRELGTRSSGGSSFDSPLGVLASLSSAIPKDIEVAIDQFEHSPPNVRLRGRGASFETVTRLEEVLRAQPGLGEVTVRNVHAATAGEGVDFELLIKLPEVTS